MISDQQLIDDTNRLTNWFRKSLRFGSHTDDIRQEIYIRLHEARERFDPSLSSWRTYAFDNARYAIRDYFRGVVVESELGDWDAVTYEANDAVWVTDFLEQLTPRERQISTLLALGYNKTEIARMLDISIMYTFQLVSNLQVKSSRYFFSRPSGSRQIRQAA